IHGSSGSGDVFADDDQEDTKSIYETEIEALFLKEDEISSSENLARIKYNRAREYYNAIKNAMVIAVNSGSKSVQIEQKVGQYAEMGGKTEGNAALKNVNVGAMIQKAKAAGRLTEALLAEMRLKTTQDMVSWNNKYHLYDYKKPVTIFEFDSYALKKSDLKNQAMSLLKDQIGGMWHKL
ncbi:MAG: hypothetical protein IKO06_04500, partial [Alphaproteobacteria bacterium]|nr:hypothetical protein [Alphaproteobacteria bacterium]